MLHIASWPDKKSIISPDGDFIISNDSGDYSIFELGIDGIYSGHYEFTSARGKNAINLGKEIIAAFFNATDQPILRGLTPTEIKTARWISRRLGFKSYGIMESVVGNVELFLLTRDEWLAKDKQSKE